MKPHPEPLSSRPSEAGNPVRPPAGKPPGPAEPSPRKTWFSHYDEEWSAFVANSEMQKKRPGLSQGEPEPLPRVWNAPHH